jgi:hypothetical protein
MMRLARSLPALTFTLLVAPNTWGQDAPPAAAPQPSSPAEAAPEASAPPPQSAALPPPQPAALPPPQPAALPPPPPVVPAPAPRTVRNSTPLMMTGIGLTSLGAVFLGVGAGYLAVREECDPEVPDIGCDVEQGFADAFATLGVVTGVVSGVVGINLWVAGAEEVPAPDGASATRPWVAVGAGSVTVGGSF